MCIIPIKYNTNTTICLWVCVCVCVRVFIVPIGLKALKLSATKVVNNCSKALTSGLGAGAGCNV